MDLREKAKEAARDFVTVAMGYHAEATGPNHRHPETKAEIDLRDGVQCKCAALAPFVRDLGNDWRAVRIAVESLEGEFKKPARLWGNLAKIALDAVAPVQRWIDAGCPLSGGDAGAIKGAFKKLCACGCGRTFITDRPGRKYHDPKACGGRVRQARHQRKKDLNEMDKYRSDMRMR